MVYVLLALVNIVIAVSLSPTFGALGILYVQYL